MEGAVRIGAVNCAEDPMLCQSQRVGAYPSLVIYPTVLHIKLDNLETISKEWAPYNERPWIVDFCDETDSCLSTINRRKLAAMLNGLVNVGTINCRMEAELCKTLMRTQEVVFYPAKLINHKTEKILDSLDPKEISEKVISYLDGLEEIEERELVQLLANKLSYRDAYSFIKESAVSPLHTLNEKTYIDAINSEKLWIIDYFAPNALHPSVEELSPANFVQLVTGRTEDETWVVDYFAPWCGPCQQLAPELQRAARNLREFDEHIHFGSVDCETHIIFCRDQRIVSYPTIRLFSAKVQKNKRDTYYDYPSHMWRNTENIERWVLSMLPSLVTTVTNDFWTTVLDANEPWVVDFFAPWCSHCVQFAPVFEQIAKILDGKVKLAKIDCEQWPGICQEAQVRSYPTVRLYKGKRGEQRQDVWGIQLQSRDKDMLVDIIKEQLEMLTGHDEL
uniref:Thioredoxin domain-containing protein n=1 Tax=Heterorhabditis bacteriophora TaxID=37862 RepID=A0A1I7XRW6_HETBA